MMNLFRFGTFSDDLTTMRIQFGARMVMALVVLTVFAILFNRWVNRR